MPKKKPDKANASKRNTEHWSDYFDRTFRGESDRACVILAAAMLEQALDVLLRARLAPVASQTDSLFDGAYAPISTFSAKIDLAFRIGLLPASLARDLHLVRKIRNDFAHNVTGCSFDDASVRGRIVEIARSQKVADWAPRARALHPAGPRGDFQSSVSWMLWWIWADTEDVEAIEAHAEETASPAKRPENVGESSGTDGTLPALPLPGRPPAR